MNTVDISETSTINSYDIDMDGAITMLGEAGCNFYELLCLDQDGTPPQSCFGFRDGSISHFYITRMKHLHGVYRAAGQKSHEWAVQAVRTALVKDGELDASVLKKLTESCETTNTWSCCKVLSKSLSHHGVASDPMTTDDLLPPRSSSQRPTTTLSAPRPSTYKCLCNLTLRTPRELLKHLHEKEHTRCPDCGRVFTSRRTCDHEHSELLVGIPAPPIQDCVYGCKGLGKNNMRRHELARHSRCTLCGFVCSVGNGRKISPATLHRETCGGSFEPIAPGRFLIANTNPADELVLGAARSGILDEVLRQVVSWSDTTIGGRLREAIERFRDTGYDG